ncbi:MAG TPA: hypothetical protein PKE37_10295, partial [Thiomonas arsenitoxydans]|uniref:hypothetical protein n=2 Tax=Thiomonas TaxID=32012 RepID=UPI002C9D339C
GSTPPPSHLGLKSDGLLALLQGCLGPDGQATCIEAAETGAIDTPIERRLREVEAEGRTIAQLSRQILSPVAT